MYFLPFLFGTFGDYAPLLYGIVQPGSFLDELIPLNVKRFLSFRVGPYLLLVDWPGHKSIDDLFPAHYTNPGALNPMPILGILTSGHGWKIIF